MLLEFSLRGNPENFGHPEVSQNYIAKAFSGHFLDDVAFVFISIVINSVFKQIGTKNAQNSIFSTAVRAPQNITSQQVATSEALTPWE